MIPAHASRPIEELEVEPIEVWSWDGKARLVAVMETAMRQVYFPLPTPPLEDADQEEEE